MFVVNGVVSSSLCSTLLIFHSHSTLHRVLLLALELARKQHTLLKAHSALTPSVREMFSNLLHAAEGEKGVAWADQSEGEILQDTNRGLPSLSVCQKALFDTFLVHASPARRLSLDKHSPAILSKPVTGILSNGGTSGGGATQESSGGSSSTSGVESSVSGNHSVSESSLSTISSSNPTTIPNKPRMPTPIDDFSSSCSSSNSVYDTRLNTVINSYHQKPSPAVLRAGRYTKLPHGHGETPHNSPHDTPSGTPEPYLMPIPSLHKLTLTRQNSERLGQNRNSASTARVASSSTSASNNPSRSTYSSTGGDPDPGGVGWSKGRHTAPASSAFTKIKPMVPPATAQSSAYTHLISKATKLQSAPIPQHRVCTKSPQTPPHSCSSSSPWYTFADNFVTVPNTYAPLPTRTPPPQVPPQSLRSVSGSSRSPQPCDAPRERSKKTSVISSQESDSSSTVKSTESLSRLLCKPYPSSSPMVTVQTHSTVVSVHPPSPPTTHHSVMVGINHGIHDKGEESLARPRPPAFIPPPPFNSIHRQTRTVSTATKCSSTVSPPRKPQPPPSKEQDSRVSDRDKADANNTVTDPAMNSTFTVEPARSPNHRPPYTQTSTGGSAGGSGGGGKSRQNNVFKPVAGALKTLYVNSPRALHERARGNTSGEH